MLPLSLLAATSAFLAAPAAAGGHFQAHKFDAGHDLDLGVLQGGFDEFFELLHTNKSDWAEDDYDVPVHDSSVERRSSRNQYGTVPVMETGLAARQDDRCESETGIRYYLCELMPGRLGLWAAGGLLTLRYGPHHYNQWRPAAAMMIHSMVSDTQYLWRRAMGEGGQGPSPPVRVRDLGLVVRETGEEPDFIHFQVEVFPSQQLQTRSVDDEGAVSEAHHYVDWAYNTKTGEVHAQGATETYAQDNSAKRRALEARGLQARDIDDFSLALVSRRENFFFWVNSRGCIEDWIDDAVEQIHNSGSHSCRMIDELDYSPDHVMHIGIHANEGFGNWDRPYGECCA